MLATNFHGEDHSHRLIRAVDPDNPPPSSDQGIREFIEERWCGALRLVSTNPKKRTHFPAYFPFSRTASRWSDDCYLVAPVYYFAQDGTKPAASSSGPRRRPRLEPQETG